MFVLNEISDDYEGLLHITDNVAREAAKCGISLDSSDVLRGLTDLIGSGFAKAYKLYSTGQPADVIDGLPDPSEIHDCYFLITEQGMERQLSELGGWPFDDQGSLRDAWTPPVELRLFGACRQLLAVRPLVQDFPLSIVLRVPVLAAGMEVITAGRLG